MRVLGTRLLEAVGVLLGIAKLERILADLGLGQDIVACVEQLPQPFVGADPAVVLAARADREVLGIFLREDHLLASRAFDPEILVGLALGEEGERIADAVEPVHGGPIMAF